ncbi:M1 family metallopeptidase [Hyphobacterium sp. CCMP332]|nr:M1 family metallopeptidase [Hyphobacterium sp. CCMP332]
MRNIFSLLLLFSALLFSCEQEHQETKTDNKVTKDAHSFADPQKAKVTHLDWDAKIDFENKIIEATATYDIETSEDADSIIFDTRDLNISQVWVDDEEVGFSIGEKDEILGSPLNIPVSSKSKKVRIAYSTSPKAAALQWLEPVQTAGKENPFLFTQSQAILARTWIPCQDSPGIRFSYNAKVEVPSGLLALMSARNPKSTHPSGVYEFVMPQPIPSYLMALAVGDLAFEEIGPRTGVYAEPSMLNASAYEFEDMEKMLVAAENLYGKYAWERYDVIVLPPSFPFGGMENPRLTFATPTIIAGDKSLTALIAHELAHSWSGNVVTNSTWDDFWLNEGFTVYFELRIMEEVFGKDYADMLALLGYQGLMETLDDMGPDNKDTRLKLDLAGRDPDDGMTDIAYEKGNFFLRTIEKTVGREEFDAFLKSYFEKFGFKPMDTEQFMTYLKSELLTSPELLEQVRPDEWVYQAGIPDNIPIPESNRFELVDTEIEKWKSGIAASKLDTSEWTTHEWLHFLRALPDSMSMDQMTDLDNSFGLTRSGNNEILGIWLVKVVANQYKPGYDKLRTFLVNVGRRKFLSPIYKEMAKDEAMKKMAKDIYSEARPNYHSVSYLSIDEILK